MHKAPPSLRGSVDHQEHLTREERDRQCDRGGGWTFEENKRFENALATLTGEVDSSDPFTSFPEKVAPQFPRKSVQQVREHLEALLYDVELIETDRIAFPEQWAVSGERKRKHADEDVDKSRVQRRRGPSWTPDEHEQFLRGLQIYGRGDWRSISRNVVMTRTPAQVASHGQKYFRRQELTEEQKVRQSINDIQRISDSGARASMSSSSPSTRYTDRK